MPTWEELKAQLEGVTQPAERNQRIAQAVTSQPKQAPWLRGLVSETPELTDEEVAQRLYEPREPELTDEEVRQRMGQAAQQPQEEERPQFADIVKRMAQNYQTSPQYQKLLDQELDQISAQIAELTQRRNMIEMAKRGQG